jgi:uncharacterized membrane protein
MEPTKASSFSKKEAIAFGFKTAKEYILFFLGLFVIWVLITGISAAIQGGLNADKHNVIILIISLLFRLLSWGVNSIISLGIINIMLKLVDGVKPEFKDLYYITKLFNFMLASMIKGLIVVGGLILFIIPGIIFSIKLQYTEYFIVDKKMDAIDAIKASWEITKGVKGNLFLLGLLLGLINILGFLCLLVGLVITVPLSMVANAYVYRKLISQSSLK